MAFFPPPEDALYEQIDLTLKKFDGTPPELLLQVLTGINFQLSRAGSIALQKIQQILITIDVAPELTPSGGFRIAHFGIELKGEF